LIDYFRDWIDGRSKRFGFGTLGTGEGIDQIGPFMPSLPRRLAMEMERPLGAAGSRNAGTYYEEQDDDEDSEDGYKEVDLYNDGTDGSDDDNFSLPDIDAPQADVQLKQLKKEIAMKEKQDLGVDLQQKRGSAEKIRRTHKYERPARLGSELYEPRKTIQLVNPATDHFAQKIATVLPPSSPLKTSSNNPGKSKKPPAKEQLLSPAVSVTKKQKESKKFPKAKEPTTSAPIPSAKSTDELENIPENSLGSSTSNVSKSGIPIQTKKVRKRKYKEEDSDTHTAVEADAQGLIGTAIINKTANKVKKSAPRRSSKRSSPPQDEAGTTSTNGTGEELPTDEMNTHENMSKKKPKKKRNPPTTVQEEPGADEMNTHGKMVTKKKKKKKNSPTTVQEEPEADNTIPEEIAVKKKKRKPSAAAPSLPIVKTEKPSSFRPSRNASGEAAPFAGVDYQGTERDPNMPILLREVVDEELDSTPPSDEMLLSNPRKQKKAVALLFKKTKTKKKSRAEKSASTQTAEEGNNGEGEGTDHSPILVPVDIDEEARQKLTENFMQDDESVQEKCDIRGVPPHEFLQPAVMMPPPSRPAPRTPKKDDVRRGLFPTNGRGFSMNPFRSGFGSQDISDPSKLSTMQLMCNPRILRAGVDLLNNLSSKKMSAIEVGSRLGFKDLSKNVKRRKRELSPDITSFPKSNSQKSGDSGEGNYGDARAVSRKESARQQRDKGHSDEELSDSEHNEEGESLIRELLDRVHANSKNDDSYEPEGQSSIYHNRVCSNSAPNHNNSEF